MATEPKQIAPADSANTPLEAEPERGLVQPRAVFIMSGRRAGDATAAIEPSVAGAQAADPLLEAEPERGLVQPRAVFIMSGGRAGDATTAIDPTVAAATGASALAGVNPDSAGIAPAVVEPIGEISQSVRATLERRVVESRAAFVKPRDSADPAASAIEDSFAAAKDGVLAVNAKAFEALRANAEANFDFVKASFAVKSPSDLIALQSEFARKRVDAMTAQVKDIVVLAQKNDERSREVVQDRSMKSQESLPTDRQRSITVLDAC